MNYIIKKLKLFTQWLDCRTPRDLEIEKIELSYWAKLEIARQKIEQLKRKVAKLEGKKN